MVTHSIQRICTASRTSQLSQCQRKNCYVHTEKYPLDFYEQTFHSIEYHDYSSVCDEYLPKELKLSLPCEP